MLKNNLKVFLRNISNQRVFSSINIIGLSLGMVICIFSIIFIRHELSYDTHHKNSDQIYRVTRQYNSPNGYEAHFARCPEPWINSLPDEFPEIETLIRFQWTPSVSLKIGDNKLRSFKWFYTDPDVFKVFDFNLINGNSKTALIAPFSVVLTKTMSEKYFGNLDPVGRNITLFNENSGEHIPYTVTGVMADFPSTSHFRAEFLASYTGEKARQGWAWIYLLLKRGADPEALKKKFPDFIKKYEGEESAKYSSLQLQSLTDIHLQSDLDREIEPNGDIRYVYIFMAAAFLSMLTAVFNFINLSTARFLKRSKEAAIRKVLGADKKHLVKYFLSESIAFSLLAFFISLIIVITVFPFFNSLLENSLSLQSALDLPVIGGFLFLAFLTGILSGIYPAFFLSSGSPVTALTKGKTLTRWGRQFNFSIRRLLFITQFSISIVLIIFTLFSYKQFSFIKNKKLGLEKEQVLTVTNISGMDRLKYPVLRDELEKQKGILSVSACMDVPSRDILDAGSTRVEGIHAGDELTLLAIESVSSNYINTMGIKLLAGENIREDLNSIESPASLSFEELQSYISSKKYSFLLNESAVKKLGFNSYQAATGKDIQWSNSVFTLSGTITGIVEDYHYASLHLEIRPLILINEPSWQGNFLIRVSPDDLGGTLAGISNTWEKIFPDSPLQYDFLDDLFAGLYRAEERQEKLLSIFSVLAILIAYLGLYGLVSFTTEQRTKEIGIRKVIGASVPGIVVLLIRDFILWIFLANIAAIPAGYFLVKKWLEDYTYRIDIEINTFLAAGVLSVLIALI
ncbi:MAG: FtsX-like permease family protein, partial [Ignavibacteriaceae bacterium]